MDDLVTADDVTPDLSDDVPTDDTAEPADADHHDGGQGGTP